MLTSFWDQLALQTESIKKLSDVGKGVIPQYLKAGMGLQAVLIGLVFCFKFEMSEEEKPFEFSYGLQILVGKLI